jgi:DNA-binding NtrC family response regulator
MKEKILVVDDEEILLKLISDFIADEGFTVDRAPNAKSAVQLLEKNEYDIIIADKNMPGLEDSNEEGGMQLLEYVRTKYPLSQFIMMTGYASIETAVAALKKGAFDYISKPLSLQDLMNTIQRLLVYKSFLNPGQMADIYRDLQKDVLKLIENKDLSDQDMHTLLKSINRKMDKFFESQKVWEKIILEQRDALANIAALAEQLGQKNQDLSLDEMIEKIAKISGQRL